MRPATGFDVTGLLLALASLLDDGEDVEITIRLGSRRVQLLAGGTHISPTAERLLSPLEAKIVEELEHGEWRSTKAIASAIGEPPDGDIRAVLRNMVERGLLDSVTSKGFRLCQSAGSDKSDSQTHRLDAIDTPKPARAKAGFDSTLETMPRNASARRHRHTEADQSEGRTRFGGAGDDGEERREAGTMRG